MNGLLESLDVMLHEISTKQEVCEASLSKQEDNTNVAHQEIVEKFQESVSMVSSFISCKFFKINYAILLKI